MKRINIFLAGMLLCGLTAKADTGETVLVGGSPADGFVTELTFSSDNVVLAFEDGTSQTVDMALVSIDLTYDGGSSETAISDIEARPAVQPRVYTISGQYVGQSTEGLSKGIYIVGGRKVVIK